MQKNINPFKFYWIASLLFLVLATFCSLIYLNFSYSLPERLSREVEVSGSLAAQDFERTVVNNISSLENLRNRIEESKGEYFPYWEKDAKRIIEQNPGLNLVEWIDNKGVIKNIVPRKGNEAALNLDITKIEYRYGDWLHHSLDTLTNITPWVKLTQGGEAFLVDVPVYYDGKFKGTLSAAMDFKAQFDRLSSYLKDFAILIKDEEGNIFYDFNNPQPNAFSKELIFNTDLVVDANLKDAWSFQFMFRDPNIIRDSRSSGDYTLVLGLLFSFFISLLAFFNLKTKEAKNKATISNQNLLKANAQLEKQKIKANKASKAKTEFLSNMSHEIRTPINAILGLADLIKVDENQPEQVKYLGWMRESSQTLLALINDILIIDKIEAGKDELNEENFSPQEVIKNIVNFHENEIEEKGLRLENEINEGVPNFVSADRTKFEQIVINLLRNAIKFTHSGTIKVEYTEKIEYDQLLITFKIKDTGIGIPGEKLARIFDRFTQVDSGMRKKHGGGGLGLAITRQLINLLKGQIEVLSTENKGTEFKVHLKFALSQSPSSDLHKDRASFESKKLRVLAVDDNKLNVVILAKILNNMGMQADLAYNGLQALQMCESVEYDIIFMDVHMPEMDGFETTKRIRRNNRKTLILGLSADATNSSIEEGIRSGMDYYLTKPLNKTKLSEILHWHFENSEKDAG